MPAQMRARVQRSTTKPRRKSERWPVLLSLKIVQRAKEIADEVGNRLIDTDLLVANVAALNQQREAVTGPLPGFAAVSFMQGFIGLGAMCYQAERCCPKEGWGRVGSQFLKIAEEYFDSLSDLDASIAEGISGVAFMITLAPTKSARRAALLQTLDKELTRKVTKEVRALEGQSVQKQMQYDTLYGIAGVGRYLLSRLPNAECEKSLRMVLKTVMDLSRVNEQGVNGFYIPYSLLPEYEKQDKSNGDVNCGLAHGIPGPLGLMALSLRQGVELKGLREATQSLANWLAEHMRKDEWGSFFPTYVEVQDTETPITPPVPSRTGWCYGAPGAARTLWLAGDALSDERLKEIAVESMLSSLRRPKAQQRLDTPGFCHGVAGALQSTLRFAVDTGLPVFTDEACSLAERLIELYNPDLFWGYQDTMLGEIKVDSPSVISGAAGVVLALLSIAYPVEPRWDEAFLLS